MLEAMLIELTLRKNELPKEPLNSIYFGGGTPSLLTPSQIEKFIEAANAHFDFNPNIEVTLEMNPDDYVEGFFDEIKAVGINRLSIGVQSFLDRELSLMNRAHNAQDAYLVLDSVKQHFDNYSIDLIYGVPGSSLISWKKNLEIALSFSPPHISSYALTVEPKTALAKQVKNSEVILLEEEEVAQQFELLIDSLTEKDFEHYELSNFGLFGYHSVNNSSYWKGKPYLGIGPSAHSYFNKERSWNVAHNKKYTDQIFSGSLPIEREKLTKIDQFNEFIMTGLRTSSGVAIHDIQTLFGQKFSTLFEEQVEKHIRHQHLYWDGDVVRVTKKAKFLIDGIASDLFLLNL